MKALVIGGNGFIGSHLVDRLNDLNNEVSLLDKHERKYGPLPNKVRHLKGDYRNGDLLTEALSDVNVVFHFAWTTIHETSILDPGADIRSNLIPSIDLIKACHNARVERIIFASSGGSVYGLAQELPIPENHPKNPISSYGISKLAVEKYLQMYAHLVGLDYIIFRFSVPYGPRQNPFGKQGAVSVFLHRVSHNLPIVIWGDGSVTRDYFYISDLVDACVIGTNIKLDQHRIFNIGGMEEISLVHLLEMVEKTLNKKAMVKYQDARKFDPPRISLNTNLAHRKLGWRRKVSLERGLFMTWRWMNEIGVREYIPEQIQVT